MKKILLFKLLVVGALVVAGCSDKHSGDSSDYGLLGDDNSTTALNGQGANDNKDSNTTKDSNGSDSNTTVGNGGKDSNSTDGNGNSDANSTKGDNNSTKGGGNNDDTNSTNGNGDDNTTSGDNNGTNGNGGTDSNITGDNGGADGNTTGGGNSNSGDTNSTNGNDGNTTTDDNSTLSEIKSISLKVTKTKLNKDSNTTVKVTAKTKDNKQIDITQKVKWLINPKGAVIINKNTLMAKKDINTTIQAKYKNLSSNKINLNIYWEVNGYILPPEPDPKINNSTLLGVDVNKNGVRDDVERWIYKTYKEYRNCHKIPEGNYTLPDGSVVPVYDVNAKEVCSKPIPYHPVVREAVMEIAKQAQIIIQKPEDAVITDVNFTKAYGCAGDISYLKDKRGRRLARSLLLDKKFKAIQFNTVQRARAYAKFNFYLSGGVYEVPSRKYILKNWCSPKIREMIKGLK